MSTWRRIILVGCTGLLVVCLALPLVPYFWRTGSVALARQRWAAQGSAHYTLIVTKSCFCPDVGEYKLTVRQGAVTAVEVIQQSGFGANNANPHPANFGDLTIEAMLDQAEASARRSWNVPWLSTFEADYDPTYGYVTRYHSDANGSLSLLIGGMVMDASYSYTAHDFQIIEP